MAKRFLFLCWLPVLLAGCAAHFTNLTPQQLRRNENNLYPVETAFNSRQESLRWDSIRPFVMVGSEFYPMQPVPLMRNRWETQVPVPADTNFIHYRFKFDYLYNAAGAPRSDSALSPSYSLKIVE